MVLDNLRFIEGWSMWAIWWRILVLSFFGSFHFLPPSSVWKIEQGFSILGDAGDPHSAIIGHLVTLSPCSQGLKLHLVPQSRDYLSYWVGQKVHCNGNTWTNFLSNPIPSSEDGKIQCEVRKRVWESVFFKPLSTNPRIIVSAHPAFPKSSKRFLLL